MLRTNRHGEAGFYWTLVLCVKQADDRLMNMRLCQRFSWLCGTHFLVPVLKTGALFPIPSWAMSGGFEEGDGVLENF